MTRQISAALYIQIFIAIIYSVNGYIVGRLLTLQAPSSSLSGDFDDVSLMHDPNAYLAASRRSDPSLSTIPVESVAVDSRPDTFEYQGAAYPSKKSQFAGSLKKFSGSGSRNCFFTPIQCIIEKDMQKYKKLVDSSVRMGGVGRK
ncbi:hypothetical protein DdX_05380 [Ditylenchus destructor]|uniref:Uncharacterized protein n=1 Tax=Ditylenchus destructor TaxID=166010 RepID=A0AAD4R9S4_9BILA|nr:hypothetical protein DdX_05380 [Ditylenchus destructor]